MKQRVLLCLVALLVITSCNKRYVFLRKVSVDHQVHISGQRKNIDLNNVPDTTTIWADTLRVDELVLNTPSNISGKQQFKKKIQTFGVRSHSRIPTQIIDKHKKLNPQYSKDEPIEYWNYNARRPF